MTGIGRRKSQTEREAEAKTKAEAETKGEGEGRGKGRGEQTLNIELPPLPGIPFFQPFFNFGNKFKVF